MRGFVSGGAGVLLAHASQGQIAAAHQTLGTGQEVANLCTKFAIGRPALTHGVSAEKRSSNVAMASAGLPCIERLQGMQVQQGSAGNFFGHHRRPLTLDSIGLCLVTGQSRAQMGIKRHSQAIGRAIFQLSGQRGPQAVRPVLRRETQLGARMRQSFATSNLPEIEDWRSARIVRVDSAHMQRRVSRCGPERVCLAGIELRVFGYFATPSWTLNRVKRGVYH